ncbi:MAG TPA: O-antigen ligase family protein [Terriglobia bacterium]|nr:O-antigen ligase family protein [Terriglobia bacterium]
MRKVIEKLFAVTMLLYTSAALLPFVAGPNTPLSMAEGSLIAIGIQVGLYCVTLFFIATRWQSFLHGALKIKWIALLLAIAVASTSWSQDPSLTLRRSALLIATTAFGIYFATRFEISEQLQLLAWTLGVVIVLSFLFGIFLPEYGIDSSAHFGDWQGVFSQKNALARAMVLSILVFLFARPGFHRSTRWVGFFASISLLILSRSLSGLIIFILLLGTLPLFKLLRTRVTLAIPVGLTLCAMLAASARFLGPSLPDFFEFVNRSSTLTGRTDIWSAVLISISKRPILGYGFDAFWLGLRGESANVLLSVHWMALHGHNGFLDLWLDLGAVGFATFVVGYLLLWRRALRVLRSSGDSASVWLCIYLAFTLLYNLTESALVRENTIYWVLYTSTAVSIFLHKSPVTAHLENETTYELEPDLNYLP